MGPVFIFCGLFARYKFNLYLAMDYKYFHKFLLDGNLYLVNKRRYVEMSNELKTPFRYDYVGSFLRP